MVYHFDHGTGGGGVNNPARLREESEGMMKYRVEDVLRREPCAEYTPERIRELFAGRESMGLDEILQLDIPAVDKYWVLAHVDWLTERGLRLVACDIAEQCLLRERSAGREPDERSWEAIKVSRKFAHGKATPQELDAAHDAASSAAISAAYNVAYDAAKSAVYNSASSAASSAAYNSAISVAISAAKSAASSAAYSAARSAAYNAAYRSASSAAISASWDEHLSMLVAAIREESEGNNEN
jgi:hypothetical protein